MARTRILLGLFGTLIALGGALWILDWSALLHAFARLSAGTVLLASLFSVATTVILAIRWAILMAGRHENYSGRAFNDALVGQVFNLITPAAVGADAYRVVVAGDREGGRVRAVAMVVSSVFLVLVPMQRLSWPRLRSKSAISQIRNWTCGKTLCRVARGNCGLPRCRALPEMG